MNAEELAHLVEDIVQTWPTGVRGRIWTQSLADLEHDAARGVYEHLRDHDEKPPTPARFHAIYHSITPEYGWQHSDDTIHVVPIHIGRQIAWQSYNEECMRAGRKPDPDWFKAVLASFARARARHPAAHVVDTSPTERQR
jgi:7-keto-8-aminopelargonate synthetase-like enzyme